MPDIKYKFTICILTIILASIAGMSFSQTADDTHNVISDTSTDLQMSIITCGPGEELYATFGHSAIRYMDKKLGIDDVYNYGTFDFRTPNFNWKFTQGKLLYHLDKSTYNDFISTYLEEDRFVKEQVLNLTQDEIIKVHNFLEYNLLPNNKYYQYDFIYDNCATRIRDAFPFALDDKFEYGTTLYNKKISYRSILNHYMIDKHWERFGINLLLGAKVDSTMSDFSAMFLPDFLFEGFKNGRYQDQDIAQPAKDIHTVNSKSIHTFNGPFWLMIGLLIFVLLAYHVRPFFYIRKGLTFIILFVSGLLGLIMLFMWTVTNHQSCDDNFNILWALPTNIIIAFLFWKKRSWFKLYGLAGISALLVSLIIHAIGIQQLPLIELVPFLGCLLYVYMDLYKKGLDTKSQTVKVA